MIDLDIIAMGTNLPLYTRKLKLKSTMESQCLLSPIAMHSRRSTPRLTYTSED